MDSLQKRCYTILSSDVSTELKLQKICHLLYSEIKHYNWVGFYFKNGDKNELRLGAYAGAPTEHQIIPYGKGICGQVAVSNETFVSQDVNAEGNYLACSIETQAEIVVPIFKNGQNIGQIDIDSHYKNSISPKDRFFLEDLMKKVALIL